MGTLIKNRRNFFPELPSIFDDFITRDWFQPTTPNRYTGNTLPAVNVKETASSFELEVAVPGMSKNDFKVELDNNVLVISAEHENKKEDKDKEGNYTRREFSYQSFSRTFSLPERIVEGDKIEAKYNDGILHIVIPKREEAKVKPLKQIQVS